MVKKIVLKGTYCLIIHLKEKSNVKIGKLGFMEFDDGYYVYTGSALNSLKARLKRHLSDEKKLFWHVDYLLANENCEIDEIVYAVDDGKWECVIATEISKHGNEIKNFGCSDCGCDSHLFHFKYYTESVNACIKSFDIVKLESKMLDDLELV